MTIDYLGFAYAATVAAGGFMGYVKAQSIPSLAAGLVFGGLLGYGAFETSQDPNNYFVSLGTTSVLTGMMAYRYYMTGKVMPAGLIAVISVANLLRLSPKLLMRKQPDRQN